MFWILTSFLLYFPPLLGPMVPPFLVTEVRNCLQQMANGGGPAAASTSASTTSTSSTSSSVADKK